MQDAVLQTNRATSRGGASSECYNEPSISRSGDATLNAAALSSCALALTLSIVNTHALSFGSLRFLSSYPASGLVIATPCTRWSACWQHGSASLRASSPRMRTFEAFRYAGAQLPVNTCADIRQLRTHSLAAVRPYT